MSTFQPLPDPPDVGTALADWLAYQAERFRQWYYHETPIGWDQWRTVCTVGRLPLPARRLFCAIAGGWTHARTSHELAAYLNQLEWRLAQRRQRVAQLTNAAVVDRVIGQLQAAGLLDTALRPRYTLAVREDDIL